VFRSPDADYDTLVEVILRAIEPDSWEENGGNGSILPFEPTMLLMVAQRAAVHARIERLLARLRQARGLNR
jgi:general secretion pathway protein D